MGFDNSAPRRPVNLNADLAARRKSEAAISPLMSRRCLRRIWRSARRLRRGGSRARSMRLLLCMRCTAACRRKCNVCE